MSRGLIKGIFFCAFALSQLSFAGLQATPLSDDHWLWATGYDRGSSETFACRDAERDAEGKLEDDCRWKASGNDYWLHGIHHGYCRCTEGSEHYFDCRVSSDAICTVYDAEFR